MVDIFSAEELAAEAAGPETPAAVEPPQQDRAAPLQDPATGRFVSPQEGAEAAQPPAERERPRQVPHEALHGEREAHKATKQERDALKARLAQFDELRQRVAAVQQQSPEPVVSPPSAQAATPPAEGQLPAPQPDNGMTHLQQRLAQLEHARAADVQQQNFAAINQHETQLITAEVNRSDAEFTVKQPDYPNAVQHLVSSRYSELKMYGHDDASASAIIQEEALQLSKTAIQLGMSPAEMAYEVAKYRGWAGGQQQAAPQNDASRMLDAIAAGQKGSKSLGAMSGGAPAGMVSADAIGQMDEAEFARLYATPEGRALIDSMG